MADDKQLTEIKELTEEIKDMNPVIRRIFGKYIKAIEKAFAYIRISIEDANKRKSGLDTRENYLDDREKNLNQRNEALNTREEKLDTREGKLKELMKLAKKSAEAFRTGEKIPPEISDKSIERDVVIMEALAEIEKQAQLLKEQTELSEGFQKSDSDIKAMNMRKAKLKASLIGVVAAYRDLLPDDDLDSFYIGEKSISIFLHQQLEDMQKLSKGSKGACTSILLDEDKSLLVSTELCDIVETAYKTIASKKMSTKSPFVSIYKHNEPDIFSYKFNKVGWDSEFVGYRLLQSVYLNKRRTFELEGEKANTPRSTLDIKEKPPVEIGMEDLEALLASNGNKDQLDSDVIR